MAPIDATHATVPTSRIEHTFSDAVSEAATWSTLDMIALPAREASEFYRHLNAEIDGLREKVDTQLKHMIQSNGSDINGLNNQLNALRGRRAPNDSSRNLGQIDMVKSSSSVKPLPVSTSTLTEPATNLTRYRNIKRYDTAVVEEEDEEDDEENEERDVVSDVLSSRSMRSESLRQHEVETVEESILPTPSSIPVESDEWEEVEVSGHGEEDEYAEEEVYSDGDSNNYSSKEHADDISDKRSRASATDAVLNARYAIEGDQESVSDTSYLNDDEQSVVVSLADSRSGNVRTSHHVVPPPISQPDHRVHTQQQQHPYVISNQNNVYASTVSPLSTNHDLYCDDNSYNSSAHSRQYTHDNAIKNDRPKRNIIESKTRRYKEQYHNNEPPTHGPKGLVRPDAPTGRDDFSTRSDAPSTGSQDSHISGLPVVTGVDLSQHYSRTYGNKVEPGIVDSVPKREGITRGPPNPETLLNKSVVKAGRENDDTVDFSNNVLENDVRKQTGEQQQQQQQTQPVSNADQQNEIITIEQVRNKDTIDPYGDKGRYTGILIRDKPHGHGTMQYDDGRSYTGNWKYGRWHGSGRAKFANGDSYIGQYNMDQRHGVGRYEWIDGRVYDGEFCRDQRQGAGTYTWPDGSVYTGEFFAGHRHGHGCYMFANGSIYTGEWSEGKYHGIGECVWADGRMYRGEWVTGRAHGYGVEFRSDGSIRHDGEWKEDRPVKRPKEWKGAVNQQVY